MAPQGRATRTPPSRNRSTRSSKIKWVEGTPATPIFFAKTGVGRGDQRKGSSHLFVSDVDYLRTWILFWCCPFCPTCAETTHSVFTHFNLFFYVRPVKTFSARFLRFSGENRHHAQIVGGGGGCCGCNTPVVRDSTTLSEPFVFYAFCVLHLAFCTLRGFCNFSPLTLGASHLPSIFRDHLSCVQFQSGFLFTPGCPCKMRWPGKRPSYKVHVLGGG